MSFAPWLEDGAAFACFFDRMKQRSVVPLAEFLEAGHRPRPAEAVAVVLQLSGRVRPALTNAVSPPIAVGSVMINASGCVTMSGGDPVEDDQTTSLLGHLLAVLLRSSDGVDRGGARVPARLRRLCARATASLPGAREQLSVANLSASLRRFAPRDLDAAVREMFERWSAHERSAGHPGSNEVAQTEAGRWLRAWPAAWRDHLMPTRWTVLPLRRRKAF